MYGPLARTSVTEIKEVRWHFCRFDLALLFLEPPLQDWTLPGFLSLSCLYLFADSFSAALYSLFN